MVLACLGSRSTGRTEPVEDRSDLLRCEPATLIVREAVTSQRDIELVLYLLKKHLPHIHWNNDALSSAMGPEIHRFSLARVEVSGDAVQCVSGFAGRHDFYHTNIVRKSVRYCKPGRSCRDAGAKTAIGTLSWNFASAAGVIRRGLLPPHLAICRPLGLVGSCRRSESDRDIEIMVLRHQVRVLERQLHGSLSSYEFS